MDVYDTLYEPENNAFIKCAIAGAVLWGGYIFLVKGKRDKKTPERRKNRQAFTVNHIDNLIDSKNRMAGSKVKTNPETPHYSRHNYNRRRRPTTLI